MPVLPSTVVAVLRTLPALDDACCAGHGPLWDADPLPGETDHDHSNRLALARSICRRCPARPACAELATHYGPRATGAVWAGRLRGQPTTRPARRAS